jgi:hypothetical protein
MFQIIIDKYKWTFKVFPLTYSSNVCIRAFQTPGIIYDISASDILNVYIKLWYESPVAKALMLILCC